MSFPFRFIASGLLLLCCLVGVLRAGEFDEAGRLQSTRRNEFLATLRAGLVHQESQVQATAAEFLAWHGQRELVHSTLEEHLGEPPAVEWLRVAAAAAVNVQEHQVHLNRIWQVAADDAQPVERRAAALKALLAYRWSPATDKPAEREVLVRLAEQRSLAQPGACRLLAADDPKFAAQLLGLLSANDRIVAAEACQVMSMTLLPKGGPSREQWLSALADFEEATEERLSDAYATAALWRHTPTADRASLTSSLRALSTSESAAVRAVAAELIASAGAPADHELLTSLVDDPDPLVRLHAADAMLRLERRQAPALHWLDWAVLAIYAIAMILVGVYYARKDRTGDDYLLGGRSMSSITVGLSLFATLFSALTFLSFPGEMIKNGPMVVAGIAAFPLVAWVVGWGLIPTFMKLPGSSGYEILEQRLGPYARLTGAGMFLALRLLWMAVIIQATTELVLVPMFGWGPGSTIWIASGLGLLTVIYTSLGGLRAVVLTDAVQTVILIGGAMLMLMLISANLGGVSQWWPQQWNESWLPLRFWFDTTADRTIAIVMVSYFTWFVCTSGSDQVAIQRYLATRDAPAARRMFNISLTVNAILTVFLALLGLALLAYYQNNPHQLPDRTTVATGADMLLPRYIVTGLPIGVSGIVVAALLAAAMSSLSSGVNSSSGVLVSDVIGYLRTLRRRAEVADAEPPQSNVGESLWLSRLMSWVVGIVVLGLSLLAGRVEGNLLDQLYKVVNLLTAPLFVLFFLALFVPRANQLGAILGTAASVATAVGISFYALGGLGVFWIMPMSFVVGVSTGAVASWAIHLMSGADRPA